MVADMPPGWTAHDLVVAIQELWANPGWYACLGLAVALLLWRWLGRPSKKG